MVEAEDFEGAAALKKKWEKRLQALRNLSASSQTEDSIFTEEAEEGRQDKLGLSLHAEEAVQALMDQHEFKAGAALQKSMKKQQLEAGEEISIESFLSTTSQYQAL